MRSAVKKNNYCPGIAITPEFKFPAHIFKVGLTHASIQTSRKNRCCKNENSIKKLNPQI